MAENPRTTSLAGSAALMASGTLVSRILGLARAALLAASIATVGGAADAFSVANKLPTIINMLIAGGVLNAVLVPQIVRALRQSDGGQRYVNQLLTLGTWVLALLTTVLTAAAGILITLYAAKLSPEWKPLALTFAYICLPQLFFYGLYTLLGQVLNAKGNFGPYMWAPALNNVVSIIGLSVYLYLYGQYRVDAVTPADWDSTRIWLVAGTATIGIAAQALVLIIPLYRSGFRYTPVFRVRGSGLGRATKVAGWAFAALAVGQLGYLIISNLAAAAGNAGTELGITIAGNASYDHAFTIFMLPQSLITVSLVTAIFTRLSHRAAAGDGAAVRDQLSNGLRTLSVFAVFATAALVVLGIPTVAVILAGSPSWEAQQAIGNVVIAFALGLVPIGVWTMVQRVYFAYEDTRSLFFIQIPMMLIVVGSSAIAYFLFPPTWWVVVGAAAGTTLSNSYGAIAAYLGLRKKLPSLDGARVLSTHLRVTLAVVAPALAGWGLLHVWGVQAGPFGSLLRVGVIGLGMAAGYLVCLRLLNVSELDGLLHRILGILNPITRRLSPLVARLPGSALRRKMGSFILPSPPKAGAVSESWNSGDLIANRYRLSSHSDTRSGDGYSLDSWLAVDEILAKEVRVLTFTGERARVAAALDSARRRAVLNDPYFPRIYRVLEEGEHGVVIADILEGPLVTDLITSRSLTPGEVRAIVGEAALGLEQAHRQGVQHLALSPGSIALRHTSVQILGLGIDAALTRSTVKSTELGARQDTIALAQILLAGLCGAWVGDPSRSSGLPLASQTISSAEQLHELAPDAPIDLLRLIHLTISPFGEGPHTPSEFAESLRPWAEVPTHQPAVVVSEDFMTGSITAAPVDGATPPGTDDPPPSPPDSPPNDPPNDPPSDPPGGAPGGTSGGTQASSEQLEHSLSAPGSSGSLKSETDADGESHARGGIIEPAASVLARPRGWDVPIGAEPATLSRGGHARLPELARPPAPAEPLPPGESSATTTFEDPHDHTFPPVSPRPEVRATEGPTTEVTRTERAVSSPARKHEFRDRFHSLRSGVARQFQPIDDDQGGEPRFNPAGFVLLGMLALVIFALVLASSSLRSARNFDPSTLPLPNPVVSTTEDPEEDPSKEEEPEEEPEEEEPVEEGPAPAAISAAISYDPTSEGGENQDLAHRAIDGDPETFWRSLRYNSPTYAIKEGLAFSVVLDEPAEVSQVTLLVLGKGGEVEIRAGDPKSPTKGDVLASGPLDSDTTFTFDEPVETDTIVLWFPKLPVADSDGMNRIELAEVSIE